MSRRPRCAVVVRVGHPHLYRRGGGVLDAEEAEDASARQLAQRRLSTRRVDGTDRHGVREHQHVRPARRRRGAARGADSPARLVLVGHQQTIVRRREDHGISVVVRSGRVPHRAPSRERLRNVPPAPQGRALITPDEASALEARHAGAKGLHLHRRPALLARRHQRSVRVLRGHRLPWHRSRLRRGRERRGVGALVREARIRDQEAAEVCARQSRRHVRVPPACLPCASLVARP